MRVPASGLVIAALFAQVGCSGGPTGAVAPADPPVASQPLAPGVLLDVPIDRDGPAIVPVQFKGKTYRFVLDTGSNHTIFDVSLREYLGKPIATGNGATPGMPPGIPAFAAPDARLGAIELWRLPLVAILDLQGCREGLDQDVRGLLGMDVLKDYVLRLDFDRGRLTIEEPNKAVAEDLGEAIDIDYDKDGRPFVIGKVMDKWDIKFLIGTANCGSVSGDLHTVYFDSIIDARRSATMPTGHDTAAGWKRAAMMRAPALRVGSLVYDGLILGQDDFFSHLGWGFLSRHNVVIDFPNKKMYLRKGAEFDRRDVAGYSGISCDRYGSGLSVLTVDIGSPAAQAGLLPGDVILTVNGKEADHPKNRNVLDIPGQEITLTILRASERKTVQFVVGKGI